jgi:diadenylate cyclase
MQNSVFDFSVSNLVDLLLVAIIIYQLYRLLKGSLAFNMIIGLITIYAFWRVVNYFELRLTERILDEFVKVGFIAILIVFQQEIRKFLLLLGKGTFGREQIKFGDLLPWNWKIQKQFGVNFDEIVDACDFLAQSKTGALIVFPKTSEMKFISASGEVIESVVSKRLIISIFSKTSPLHDGAMIIAGGKIKAANAVLPVSENPDYQNKYGLRHLSAIGITEQTDAIAIVVSEEKGSIAIAKEGQIFETLSNNEIVELLTKEFANQMIQIR